MLTITQIATRFTYTQQQVTTMKKLSAIGLFAGTVAFIVYWIVVVDYASTKVVRATDEEHTNEQASFAFDPVLKDTGVVIMMSSGRLNSGEVVEASNTQGSCMPIKLVPTGTGVGVSVELQPLKHRYISQRQSDENRAFYQPEVNPIGNGLFAVFANWDRTTSTNTERYMQVFDANCNRLQLTGNVTVRENGTSAVIMAKNKVNCSDLQASGGASVHIYADGSAGIMSKELCIGNGHDDGWANYLKVSCADGTCDIQKQFDVSVIDQEESNSGRCEQLDLKGDDGKPDTSICCGTEGNALTQRKGVWCSGIDHSSGEILYKERVAYRGQTADGRRTYAMRMKLLAERDIAGAPTGKLYIQYNMHRSNNNQKGGYDDAIMMAIATPTRTGLNVAPHQDITSTVITSQIDLTHATMFLGYFGTPINYKPVISFLSSIHNGSGGVNVKIMNIIEASPGVLAYLGVQEIASPFDSQKYSIMRGVNSNNQGRNHINCRSVPNPFVATAGPAQGIPVLNMCIMTGNFTYAVSPSIKPDLFFEIWATVVPNTSTSGSQGF